MAKKIAPPKTGKHETQSLLTGGADKDTKYFSQDKLAPNKEAPKLVTGEYPVEPKLLGRGAAGANAAAAENPKRSDWKSEGWDIKRSDFDNLVDAINLNIMNSYTKFRNKKDLDFSAFDKKPEGKKTKLDAKDTPSLHSQLPAGTPTGRSQGRELGSDSKGQLSGLRGGKGKRPASGQVFADPSILASRRGGEAKPTKVTNQYKNPKTGLMETEEQLLDLTPSKERKRGKVVTDTDTTKKPTKERSKNPYRQDEKGKYVRGTGYDKKITGSRTAGDKTHAGKQRTGDTKEAHPATRYNRRHEGKIQHGGGKGKKFFTTENTGDPPSKKNRIGGGRDDDALGIETTDPLAPHKHLREQDKEGKIVRNRVSTKDPFEDPKSVKWQKGGRKRDRKEAERAVRQGMQNLKGMGISYKGSRMGIKLKGERHASRGRSGSKTPPLGGEERAKDWWKYWKENTEKSLDALLIKIEDIGWRGSGARPAKETFGDERFRGNPAGVVHKKPKNEKHIAENAAGKELTSRQWDKEDFKMNYSSPDERATREAKEWQKKKMALLKAFLSPITFKYKWGHTYERGQTKNVETQDHSRTGNTNTNQTYKKDKDDLTIKSLDEIFNEWKNKKQEK